MVSYPERYVKLLVEGPFPSRIDLWAEVGYYFHQIHSGLIHQLLEQLQPRLLHLGYIAGREASLQIADGREPDIYVQRTMDSPFAQTRWDYALAAQEVLAEAGIVVEGEFQLDGLHIKEAATGRVVTVVEIVSPGNKTKPDSMRDYQHRREQLIIERGINVVEMDFTRSIKRLSVVASNDGSPYHIMIYIPGQSPRFIGIPIASELPRIALPLKESVIAVDVHPAYQQAYRVSTIAAQIHANQHYTGEHLPFPTILSTQQKESAQAKVVAWQEELTRLKTLPD
ncbi:MAG: DUF4058 family protein [Aggregatilineales bacterium]